jgi:hypothetical protein
VLAGERNALWLLAAALVLWVLSRTQRGQAAAAAATDSVMNAVRGLRNKNPGNLRANGFTGSLGVDPRGYAVFDTLHHGIRAAARQLDLYGKRGLNTVRMIVSTWAPASENDTEAYIAAVCRAVGRPADGRLLLDESTHLALLRAIFRHELGAAPAATISDAQILAGIGAL